MYDVCVVGLGAGGFAAAYSAAKEGLNVIAIEPNLTPGGTGVYSFVSVWPAGPAESTSSELFEALKRIEEASSEYQNGSGIVGLASQHNGGIPNKKTDMDAAYNPGSSFWVPENYVATKITGAGNGTFTKTQQGVYAESGINLYSKSTLVLQQKNGLWGRVGKSEIRNAIFEGDKTGDKPGGQMGQMMMKFLSDAGVTVKYGFGYKAGSVVQNDEKVSKITITDGVNEEDVEASIFIDSSANLYMCRDCKDKEGNDITTTDKYDDGGSTSYYTGFGYNGTSISYLVTFKKNDDPYQGGAALPNDPQMQGTFVTGFPGKYLYNIPLNYVQNPFDFLNAEGTERKDMMKTAVENHWNEFKACFAMHDYELVYDADGYPDMAPKLGTRESYRIISDDPLTYEDLRKFDMPQFDPNSDSEVDEKQFQSPYKCIKPTTEEKNSYVVWSSLKADYHHPATEAGPNEDDFLKAKWGLSSAKDIPKYCILQYGVPYQCMIPKDFKNVLVACRGAGFTHIAASSCRLIRTMMGLGHAAGKACLIAMSKSEKEGKPVNVKLDEDDVKTLSRYMRKAFIPDYWDDFNSLIYKEEITIKEE